MTCGLVSDNYTMMQKNVSLLLFNKTIKSPNCNIFSCFKTTNIKKYVIDHQKKYLLQYK